MLLEYLYFTMQMEKYSQVHLRGGAERRDAFIYIMHSCLFVTPVCASMTASLSSLFFFLFISALFSLSCSFFRLVSVALVLEMRVTVFFCYNNWMK